MGRGGLMPRSARARRELRDQVAQVLRSLGDDKDDVARQLGAAGVRGRPGDVGDCALAVYLSAVVTADPRVVTVRVLPVKVLIRMERRWWPVTVKLPRGLRAFIADFDQRRYPSLVRPRAEADRSGQHASRS
jgi:hypothetical protein